MDLKKIVAILDKEFEIADVKDDWQWFFDKLFIKKSLPSFRTPEHNTGLMIMNGQEIQKIYTAFAPSRYVLEEIHMKGMVHSLLIVKHPFDWDGRRNGKGFIHFTERDYQLMEASSISIYSLNTPLDKNRNDKVVSSAYSLAKVLKLKVEEEFGIESEHNPEMTIGLIGRMQETKLSALIKRISTVLDYKIKLRKVNDHVGRVAVVPGECNPRLIEEAKEREVSTYITGSITPHDSDYCRKHYAQDFAAVKKMNMNIIGCSHYLSEKWAMLFSLPYFSQLGKAEFIEDKEALNLLE